MTMYEVNANNYYAVKYSGDNRFTIIKAKKNSSFRNSIGIRPEGCYFLESNCWSATHNLRLATSIEIAHLNACIKANKYVEFESINKIIEIW